MSTNTTSTILVPVRDLFTSIYSDSIELHSAAALPWHPSAGRTARCHRCKTVDRSTRCVSSARYTVCQPIRVNGGAQSGLHREELLQPLTPRSSTANGSQSNFPGVRPPPDSHAQLQRSEWQSDQPPTGRSPSWLSHPDPAWQMAVTAASQLGRASSTSRTKIQQGGRQSLRHRRVGRASSAPRTKIQQSGWQSLRHARCESPSGLSHPESL